MNNIYCDVLVCGGGCAGVSAAISSAKNGSDTILIEESGFLGGALTKSGVSPMSSLYAGKTKVVAGFVDDLLSEMKNNGFNTIEIGGDFYPISIAYETEGLKYSLEKLCIDNNVTLMYHTTLLSCQKENNKITSCTVYSKGKLYTIEAKCFIDATGDANLATMADVECVYGDNDNQHIQSMSTILHIANVNDDCIDRKVSSKTYANCVRTNDRRVLYGFEKEIIEAREKGLLSFYPRTRINAFETGNKGEYMINMSIVNVEDAFDPIQFSKAEIEGRKQAIEIFNFLKTYIPCFSDSILVSTGSSIGVRETRKIKGLYTLTQEDLLNNVMFKDAIAMGAYPIDLHNSNNGLIERKKLKENSWYSIPYRCLVTDSVDNLIVTGRCISSNQIANSALRVSLILMAISQAAGIAASMSVIENVSTKDVNIDKLRSKLLENGAFLQEYSMEE